MRFAVVGSSGAESGCESMRLAACGATTRGKTCVDLENWETDTSRRSGAAIEEGEEQRGHGPAEQIGARDHLGGGVEAERGAKREAPRACHQEQRAEQQLDERHGPPGERASRRGGEERAGERAAQGA